MSLALKPAVDRVARIVNPAYVRTPLLQENLDSPVFDHFVIEPETVAGAVVEQLHSGNGGHLILPARYTIACALRRFPSWMQELARNSVNQGRFAIHGFSITLATVFYSHLLRLLNLKNRRACFSWNSRKEQNRRNGLAYPGEEYVVPVGRESEFLKGTREPYLSR